MESGANITIVRENIFCWESLLNFFSLCPLCSLWFNPTSQLDEYILMMRWIASRQTLQNLSERENMMQSTSGR